MSKALEGFGDYSDDLGEVDMFGLDEFGNAAGWGAGWGALIGVGLSSSVAVGVRALVNQATSPNLFKWSEGIGAAAAVVAGGVMMAFKKTRHAGLVAGITGLVSNGVRQVEKLMAPKSGWGETVMTQLGPVVGGGFGLATVSTHGRVLGDSGPQLVGGDIGTMQARQANLLGIPSIGGPLANLANGFGATVLGGGR